MGERTQRRKKKGRWGGEHLRQVVDDEGEQENQDAVEKNFGQTNQQASSLQGSLRD